MGTKTAHNVGTAGGTWTGCHPYRGRYSILSYLRRLEAVKGVVGIGEVRAEDLLSCVSGGSLESQASPLQCEFGMKC